MTSKKDKDATDSKALADFMGGAVVPQPEQVAAGLAALGATAMDGGKQYLKMTKAGEWLFGADDTEVEAGEQFAINPMSMQHGYIGWKTATVVGEHMVSLFSGESIDPAKLAPIQQETEMDGWSKQLSVELKSMSDGTELVFKTTSHGGKNALAKLSNSIARRIAADPVHYVPVVELSSSSYKHKTYGTIYNPVIEIVGWVDVNGKAAPQEAA